MDIKMRDYTEWQIERIRLALNRYRIAQTRNRRRPSWAAVCDAIVYAKPNIERYKRDPDSSFLPERLRRFAHGEQRLEADKLADTARFLIHAGMLKAAELDDESKGDLAQFLAVRDFLGSASDSLRACVAGLKGSYAAMTPLGGGKIKSLLLRLVPDPSQTFLRVEEVLYLHRPGESVRHPRADDMRMQASRIGYALPVTPRNVLHIFLNGFMPDQRITYVQAGGLGDAATPSSMVLMRSGETPELEGLAAAPDPTGLVSSPNVYRFTAASDEGEA